MDQMNKNQQWLEDQILHPENWKKTHKLKYSIWAKEAPVGTTIYNVMEKSFYTTTLERNIVLSGITGEQWIIDRKKLNKTYSDKNGNPVSLLQDPMIHNGWTPIFSMSESDFTAAAIQIPKEYRDLKVKTSWGDILIANNSEKKVKGDFILVSLDEKGQPNMNDLRVVDHDIFLATYDSKAFGDNIQIDMAPPKAPKRFVSADPKDLRSDEKVLDEIE